MIINHSYYSFWFLHFYDLRLHKLETVDNQKKTRLESFRHVEHKDDADWVTCYDDKGGGHQSKTWWNCIRDDMKSLDFVRRRCTVQK